MNDHSVIDIQKHNNKINRILNKICEQNPELSEQIDLALYSCLKIDKIIKKHLQTNPIKTVQYEDNMSSIDNRTKGFQAEEDQLYENALNIVEGFKMATKKLQNKVAVLLKEHSIATKVQRTKYHHQIQPDYQISNYKVWQNTNTVKDKKKNVPTYEDSPQIVGSSQSKSKKNHYNQSESKKKSIKSKSKDNKHSKHMNESQSFQQMQKDSSKNISQIDLQIVDLVSQIKDIMEGQ